MIGEQQPKAPRSLLAISEASRILGVSEATLRQWTDEGKLKAFITPGGHRRYVEADLQQFLSTNNRRTQNINDLVAQIELAPSMDAEIAHTRFAETPWYGKLSAEEKGKLAELGRRIHRIVILYISKQDKQDETMQLARETGYEFGQHLSSIRLSLTDAIEAFLLHRSPLVNAANDLLRKREPLHGRVAEAIPLVTQITDKVLLSLVEAYQSNPKTAPDQNKGNSR